MIYLVRLASLLMGWALDLLLGDPVCIPHPIVFFGKLIAWGEHRLNCGNHVRWKGGMLAVGLILLIYIGSTWMLHGLMDVSWWLAAGVEAVLVFFCLAGTTLIREVEQVFVALERGVEVGRRQVARIVGRDTGELTEQEILQAALETLAENLSDGVIAPLFWWALLGVPGMLAYKMANTLDSMIGYRTQRYARFGTVAARIDDVANYIPARLTALMMLAVTGRLKRIRFVLHYGKAHLSPNSGYPESALAAILDCRFGGSHQYFGELIEKPMIGFNPRKLGMLDMKKAIIINRSVELLMITALSLCNVLLLFS